MLAYVASRRLAEMGIYYYNFHEVILHDEVGFGGNAAVWGVTFPPAVQSLTHTLEGSTINSWVHKVGLQWNLTLFCHQCPMWGKWTFIHVSLAKVNTIDGGSQT